MAILTLDPLHPTLDHHRPGEFPLFGTAMGIGALIEGGKAIGLCGDTCRVDAIEVRAPYILDHIGPHHLIVDVAPSGAGQVRSVLQSNGNGVVHFSGHIGQNAGKEPWRPPELPAFTTWNSVDQAQIYQAFFHGPAFQVVGTAQFHDSEVIAQLADTPPTRSIPAVSRLIEFALQSAGLLELALSGRMLIPAAIGTVEIFGLALDDADHPIFAHATQQAITASANRCDITVWAQPEVLIARISGYKTVELPFPVASEPMADLRRHLRGLSQ